MLGFVSVTTVGRVGAPLGGVVAGVAKIASLRTGLASDRGEERPAEEAEPWAGQGGLHGPGIISEPPRLPLARGSHDDGGHGSAGAQPGAASEPRSSVGASAGGSLDDTSEVGATVLPGSFRALAQNSRRAPSRLR